MTKLRYFLRMVDFEHTFFGLPFAYLGAFLAQGGLPPWEKLFWITVAMISARTAALSLNRIIDLKYDAVNHRTAHWVLPAGKLDVTRVWIGTIIFFILLFVSAAKLNPLCFKLAPLAVIILWGYSYTKRFTWWCHLILGVAIGIGPIGAWIAITGTFDWQPLILGAAVAGWIAGFDTMYACQDIEFDRQNGLYSIPARFGEVGALRFSAVFHLFTVTFLILTGVILSLGLFYYLGITIASIILVYEHIIVKPGDLSRVNFASFKINRYVGLIIFVFTLWDLFSASL